jgi:ribosomal protein S18 acetylase RimI-like enzyme
VWREAGFEESGQLLLFEHDLASITDPGLRVEEEPEAAFAALNRIDRESFMPRWRLGPLGLAESVSATGRAMIHTVRVEGELAGFAITGVSLGVGYLQRLAVDPRWRGEGWGRALVRESLRWARRRRVVTVLVNTQPDNEAAAGLYRSEGFHDVPAGLRLWTFRG